MNNLDNFYNKKLQNREFEFKDSYWEEAEQMIIADEKNRRTGLYFWPFGLLLFLVFAGGAIFWIGNPKSEAQESAAVATKTDSEVQTTIAKSTNQSVLQSNDQTSKGENNASELSLVDLNADNQNIPNADYSNDEIKDLKKNSITAKSTETSTIEDFTFSKETKSITNKNSKEYLNEVKSTKQEILLQNDESHDAKIENTTLKTNSKEAVDPDIATVTLLLPIASLSNEIEKPPYEELKPQSIPKSRNFKLGLTASSLFYPANNNEKAWIGASLGLVGQYKLLKNFSINTEVLYTYRSGTFGTVSKTGQSVYGFGKQVIEYHSKPESMHFMELPVFVQYHLGRHGIEAGFTFSYLVGVYGEIEKQTSLQPWERVDGNNFSKENHHTGWIAKDGFNSLNTSFLMGYRYTVSQNFVLGLRSSYRFGDLLKVSENKEQALLESGALHFNISASWFFLK